MADKKENIFIKALRSLKTKRKFQFTFLILFILTPFVIVNLTKESAPYYIVELDRYLNQETNEVKISKTDERIKECGVPPKKVNGTFLVCLQGKWSGAHISFAN